MKTFKRNKKNTNGCSGFTKGEPDITRFGTAIEPNANVLKRIKVVNIIINVLSNEEKTEDKPKWH